MFNETAYNLALDAGCSSAGAITAAAIAQAESSGNARAYNPETAAMGGTPAGQGSYGLWQIYRKQHPEFNGWDLYDPATNARAMFAVSGGCSSWGAWSTYNNRAYRNFLPASGSVPGGGDPAAGGGGEISSGGEGDYSSGGGLLNFDSITMPVDFFSGAPAWLPAAALIAAAFFLLK